MASYTAKQYGEQHRTMALIIDAMRNCRCPICRQPAGRWADGVARLTCGSDRCYRKWLQFRPEREEKQHEEINA